MSRFSVAIILTALVTGCTTAKDPTVTSPTLTPTESTATEPAAQLLLFATKSDTRVQVSAVDPDSGEVTDLFSFDERAQADAASGNFREALPPSVALSPDGSSIAFARESGLALYDLATRDVEVLIERVAPGENADLPSTWDPPLEDTFSVYGPSWSGDGTTIGFNQGLYEGNSYGFFEVAAGRYRKAKKLGVSYFDVKGEMRWAAQSSRFVVARLGLEDLEAGWYAGDSARPRGITFTSVSSVRVEDARPSPDGHRVVSIQGADDPDAVLGTGTVVAVARVDGSQSTPLDEDGEKHDVFFSAEGEAVFWIEASAQGASLMRFETLEQTKLAGLAEGFRWSFVAWTDQGVLIAGRDTDADRSRGIIVDPARGDVVARHDSQTSFTTYLGVAAAPA